MSELRKLSNLSIASLCVLAGLIIFGVYQFVLAKPEVPDDEFGSRVRAYLLSNPQVLREVIEELSKREKTAAAEEQSKLVSSLGPDLEKDGFSYVAGNPDGDVTIVEFFDYRCGYCKKSFPELMKTVAKDGNIRLVLKEFPILGADSILAAQAAIASLQQGKYMEFHTALMEARGGLSKERIFSIAADVGLDVDKLTEDMQKPEVRDTVESNYALAKKLGIDGTPAFVIADRFIPGAISAEQMQEIVAGAREKNQAAVEADKKS